MENKNTLVSIVIPIYNSGLFLGEAIDSVLQQSLKDIEIILVNDGSTDNSISICKEYLENDNRIRFINQENQGVSVARNKGLEAAKGEYIFFMDSDDTINPHFIEQAYQIAKKNDDDIVIVGKDFCERLTNVSALPTCSLFLKHDFLKKNSEIKFPPNIQPCEDGLFSHMLLTQTKKIGTYPEGIYNYRSHENQNHLQINQNSWKVIHQIPTWFDLLESFYKDNHLLSSKYLHLALFLEHEPFEFRYLGMKLDDEQKDFLHKIIQEFYKKNVAPYIKEDDFLLLSEPFRFFIHTDNSKKFDLFYLNYKKNRKRKQKMLLFLTKFIPFSKIRRSNRQFINKKYG